MIHFLCQIYSWTYTISTGMALFYAPTGMIKFIYGGITIDLTNHLRMHLLGQGYSMRHLIGKRIFNHWLTKMKKKYNYWRKSSFFLKNSILQLFDMILRKEQNIIIKWTNKKKWKLNFSLSYIFATWISTLKSQGK